MTFPDPDQPQPRDWRLEEIPTQYSLTELNTGFSKQIQNVGWYAFLQQLKEAVDAILTVRSSEEPDDLRIRIEEFYRLAARVESMWTDSAIVNISSDEDRKRIATGVFSAYFQLGAVYSKLGAYDKALNYFTRAKRLYDLTAISSVDIERIMVEGFLQCFLENWQLTSLGTVLSWIPRDFLEPTALKENHHRVVVAAAYLATNYSRKALQCLNCICDPARDPDNCDTTYSLLESYAAIHANHPDLFRVFSLLSKLYGEQEVGWPQE